MKRITFSLNIATLIFLIISVGIFFWQLKSNINLKKTLAEGKEKYRKEEEASRNLEALEQRSEDLKQKEIALNKMIPEAEENPLNMVRILVRTAMDEGIKVAKFTIVKKSSKNAEENSSTTPSDLLPFNLKMEFRCSFPQLLAFFKKLNSLDRIITVEKINIKRDKKIIPFQKISLELTSYTFVKK